MSIAIIPIDGKLTTLFYDVRVQRVWIMNIKGGKETIIESRHVIKKISLIDT